MSVNSQTFLILLVFSLGLIGTYHWGMRYNLRLCRKWAQILEGLFSPQEKEYTWLGGVIGFTAEYKVFPFRRIKAVLRLVPRHSLLYWPFAFLMGRRDCLQILFYLPQSVKEEVHLIRKGLRMPYISSQAKLKKQELRLQGVPFILLFEKEPPAFGQSIGFHCLSGLKHLALTKENNVCYLELFLTEEAEVRKLIKVCFDLFLKLKN